MKITVVAEVESEKDQAAVIARLIDELLGNQFVGTVTARRVDRVEELVSYLRKASSEAEEMVVGADHGWFSGRMTGKADAWALAAQWLEETQA